MESVWAVNSRYYIDGKSVNVPISTFQKADADALSVGCWCCPNNNQRAQFLSRIYMPEQFRRWRQFLLGFAVKIGKPDPETYVDSGNWKARQGGKGLASAGDVKILDGGCMMDKYLRTKLRRAA